MKKIIVLSLLALCLFCECNREYEAPKSFNGKTITATLAETKARLGEKSGNAYPNYWSAGDAISVNGVASDPLDASFDGKSQAEFTIASAVAPFKAVYPASVVMSFTGGAAGLTLPAVQNYTAGSYDPSAYVMIAHSETDSPLAFEPVMSLFKIVPSGSVNVASVELSALGENKLSGSFTTDFSGLQAAEGASGSVKIDMPEGGVAPGTPIIICIPAGDYTAGISVKITDIGGGQMYRTAKPSKQYAAGTMYGAEISYVEDVLTAQVSAATSSSLIFTWDGPLSHAFMASLYSDAGCTQSVASFNIPAGDTCWGEAAPKFVIGGLSPGTDYWFKATDTTSGLSSGVVKGTTSAFTHVQMPTTISETGTVLAEDFGEIRWHSDMINAAAGFIPTNIGSFSNSGVREYVAGNTNSGEIPFTENTAPLQSSRLKNWAVDSRAFYHCGHLNLGNNLGNGWILTPEFTVPSEKKATVKLTITAARYNESQETEWAVVVLDQSGANVTGNTASFTWPDSYKTVALSKNREWETVSVNGLELRAGDRIAFGPKKGTARNKGRVFINDLKAEVLQLTDVQDTPIVANTLEITSSTLAFTWNEKGEEAADANLKYVPPSIATPPARRQSDPTPLPPDRPAPFGETSIPDSSSPASAPTPSIISASPTAPARFPMWLRQRPAPSRRRRCRPPSLVTASHSPKISASWSGTSIMDRAAPACRHRHPRRPSIRSGPLRWHSPRARATTRCSLQAHLPPAVLKTGAANQGLTPW